MSRPFLFLKPIGVGFELPVLEASTEEPRISLPRGLRMGRRYDELSPISPSRPNWLVRQVAFRARTSSTCVFIGMYSPATGLLWPLTRPLIHESRPYRGPQNPPVSLKLTYSPDPWYKKNFLRKRARRYPHQQHHHLILFASHHDYPTSCRSYHASASL